MDPRSRMSARETIPVGASHRELHLLAPQRALLIWGLGGFHRVRSPGGEGVGRQKIEPSRKTVSTGSVYWQLRPEILLQARDVNARRKNVRGTD